MRTNLLSINILIFLRVILTYLRDGATLNG